MRRDTRRIRKQACLTTGAVVAAIVAGVVGGPGQARADEPSVAVSGVVPADVRLRRMPRLVREIVAELDGRARPGVLWRRLARAAEAGSVLRLALSLQAIVRDRNGNLQLTYGDGTRLDIDIRLISDNYEPAPDHAVKYAYLGPGNRIYPLRMGPDTTPRLWAAKHGIALAATRRSNEQFEEFLGIATTGVMSTLPLGLMAPVYPIPPPRLVVPRVVTPGNSGAASSGGPPTLEIQAGKNRIKIRYGE